MNIKGEYMKYLLGLLFLSSSSLFASTGEENSAWLKMAAAGLTIAIAVIAGVIAQAKTASTALDGIARNPSAQNKIFIPMLISLALIESLVIYALVVVFVKM